MKRQIHSKKQGFTLIELIVTLAIAGILMAYAIPSYTKFSIRQRISNEANDLLGDIMFARVTAIKEGQRVTLTTNSGNGDWSDGWVITLDSSAVSIREKQEINQYLAFNSTIGGTITFTNIGNATAVNNIVVSHADSAKTVTVSVAMSGMITTTN